MFEKNARKLIWSVRKEHVKQFSSKCMCYVMAYNTYVCMTATSFWDELMFHAN